MKIAKAIAAVVVAVLAAILPGLTNTGMGIIEWVNVAILALGALQVFNADNTSYWQYGKLIASALSAGLVVFSSAFSFGVSPSEWVQIGLAIAGAVAVWRLPNQDAHPLGRATGGRHERPE